MSPKEKFISLLEQEVKTNWELMSLASKMPPDEQLKYLPKIEASIENTKRLLEEAKG